MDRLQKYYHKLFTKELRTVIDLSKSDDSNKIIEPLSDLSNNQFNWNSFNELTQKHRLISHVYKNIQVYKDKIPEQVLNHLKSTKIQQTKTSILYTKALIELDYLLKESSIPYVYFKGALLSLDLYNDIGVREYRDLDLLVSVENVEHVDAILKNSSYRRIAPKKNLSPKQIKTNYNLSHHYHYYNEDHKLHIELHWNLTNPKSFFPLNTKIIINESCTKTISGVSIPYISNIHNLVFLAAHGAIHQWYRLFWLKDFSVLVAKSTDAEMKQAWDVALKLKLDRCFSQGIYLANLLYGSRLPDYMPLTRKSWMMVKTALKSIATTELKQQKNFGKLKYVKYRLSLRNDFKYRFDLLQRLRTHFTDWEIINLPDSLFFLYYFLRPILFAAKLFVRK